MPALLEREPRASAARTRSRPGARRRRRLSGWVVGAVLYGFAWPLSDATNLSFLAWFAFVPLFIELERRDRFGPFAVRALGFMAVATFISCWWWFLNVPTRILWMTWIGGIHEILLETVPLLLLYAVRKKLPYRHAIWTLVPLWPLWEWLYNQWELSMGYALLAHSQAGNLWLVQFADILGVWAVTGWVVLFNVMLYRAFTKCGRRFTAGFWRRTFVVALVLTALPAFYALYRAHTLAADHEIVVTTVHTDFEPIGITPAVAVRRLERIVHLTDSVTYYATRPSDLYVWPEGAITLSWNAANTRRFVSQAVDDWKTPLVAGYIGDYVSAGGDTISANQAVLIPADGDTLKRFAAYTKRRLVPFFEGLPHRRFLADIPFFSKGERSRRYHVPGKAATLLPLFTRTGQTVQLATPICHEQQFPAYWTEWARNGADLFVHLSFESWFGERMFQTHFVNIMRLRAIENRRGIVRASNGGASLFMDAFGRTHGAARRSEGAVTASAKIYSGMTLYTRYPNLFVYLSLLGLLGIGGAPYVRSRILDRSSVDATTAMRHRSAR